MATNHLWSRSHLSPSQCLLNWCNRGYPIQAQSRKSSSSTDWRIMYALFHFRAYALAKGRIPVDIKTRLPIRNFTSLSAFTEVNPVEVCWRLTYILTNEGPISDQRYSATNEGRNTIYGPQNCRWAGRRRDRRWLRRYDSRFPSPARAGNRSRTVSTFWKRLISWTLQK